MIWLTVPTVTIGYGRKPGWRGARLGWPNASLPRGSRDGVCSRTVGGGAVAILEGLKVGGSIRGLSPEGLATIVQVEWYGNQAVNVTFRDAAGAVKQRLVYRTDEPTLEVATAGRPWSFDGDGALLRLVSEAYRIRLPTCSTHIRPSTRHASSHYRTRSQPSMARCCRGSHCAFCAALAGAHRFVRTLN